MNEEFTRNFLLVPAAVLYELRQAILDDSVDVVNKIFDSLVVDYEGVGIDTTIYAEDGHKSLCVLSSSQLRRRCHAGKVGFLLS